MNNKTNVLELTDSELGMLDELVFNGASELNYLFSQNQKDKVKKVMGKIEYALYLKMKKKNGKPNLHLDKLLGKIKGFE